MDYPKSRTTDANSALNVEEPTLCAYSPGAGSGSAVLDDVEIYVDVDLDDDDAVDAELGRLETIMVERGIIKPPREDWENDPDLPLPPTAAMTTEEIIASLLESIADTETYSSEEVSRWLNQKALNRARQAIINGHA